ncbi:MAG: hypothetical protein ISS93_01210 [Candidatus Aenigmarchaeota archaeon]|nr:hypothetical protein [Candidatus Aenigmarchaeota archaeon]
MPIADDVTLVLIGINILLTVILVLIYLRSYRAISSKLTLGLLVFAGAFLIENVLDFFFYSSILQQSIYGLTTFHMAVNLLEMVALLILAWVTWK